MAVSTILVSLPAIMKKWLDEVFTHGFAHGSTAKLCKLELAGIKSLNGISYIASDENAKAQQIASAKEYAKMLINELENLKG